MSSTASYPRPDFQRSSLTWESLDGPWGFAFDDQDCGLASLWHQKTLPADSRQTITVPYAFQMPASGIGKHEAHEVIWYERLFRDIRTADQVQAGHRLLARFGAVDYECSVWVNGQFVGTHRGGHVPFDVDVTDALGAAAAASGEGQQRSRLTLRVRDSPYDLTQPRGKQYWKPVSENIWYTPSSGIWQSVWLESVPRARLGGSSEGTILRSDDIENGQLRAEVAILGQQAGAEYSVEIEASLGSSVVGKSTEKVLASKTFARLSLDMKVADGAKTELQKQTQYSAESCWHNGVALWQPEHPILYNLILRLFNDTTGKQVDEVHTTTGMRKLDWRRGDGTFRLNNKPYFQALVLDQGYWPETGMTPPSPEALKVDIEIAKAMGFNGCRKHQKVEDPVFLYWADRLGYLVWGEMANAYEFDQTYAERFEGEWMQSVRRDVNHPCIVTWTPNNESWGYTALEQDVAWAPGNVTRDDGKAQDTIEQRNHIRSLYYQTKTLDPSRPINDNCGWEHVLTDLTTYHDYADAPELAVTCANLEGESSSSILGTKANHVMFASPIVDQSAAVLDPGASHVPGAPVICTEFGGVNIAPAAEEAAGERDWGYTTASDPEDLLKRLRSLVMAVVQGGHTCGFVYTQLCDIEQEVNGLYSFNRKAKIPAAQVKEVIDSSIKYYFDKVAPK